MNRLASDNKFGQSINPWIFAAGMFLLAIFSNRVSIGQDSLQIDSVNVYGLTTNAVTTLDVRGKGFDDSLQLILPFDVEQKLNLISSSQAQIEVRVADISPRICWGAFRTRTQLAGSRRWAIDAITNRALVEKVSELPTSLNGTLSGNQVQRINVELKEGDYLFVDVQARRLGATFQPLLRVLDEKNRQLASGGPSFSMDGDANCKVRIPKTGTYIVALQDLTFAAPTGPFRLRLARTADEALWRAPRVEARTSEPLGRLFSLAPFPDGRSLGPLDLGLSDGLTRSATVLPRSLGTSWNRFTLEALVAEDVPNVGKVFRVPSLPAIVSGTIQKRESLKFVLNCGVGSPLEAEVWATRLGANFDPKVSISHLDQRILSQGDDRPGTIDPIARFAGDPGVADVLVAVESVIPIALDQQEGFELVLSQPKFEAVGMELSTSQLVLNQGGTGLLDVKLIRNGMDQPVELAAVDYSATAEKNPEQSWVSVPGGQQRALVPVQVASDLATGQWFTVVARYPGQAAVRIVQAVVPGRNVIATGAAEHTIPVIQTPAPPELDANWLAEVTEPVEFIGGRVYQLPLVWRRTASSEGEGKLQLKGELVTTQNIPRLNPQDANSPFEYRRALQLGMQVPGQQSITITSNGDPKNPSAPASATVAVGSENMLRLLVPADAVEDNFQWSLRWSILREDGTMVGVAGTTTPKLGRIVAPLTFRLEKDLPNPWSWSNDESQNVIQVMVESQPGVSGTAQIVFQGVPQGISVPPQDVVLSAEPTKVAVRLPNLGQQSAGTKLEGLKLVLQWNPNFEGSGVFTSPVITLPPLHFP